MEVRQITKTSINGGGGGGGGGEKKGGGGGGVGGGGVNKRGGGPSLLIMGIASSKSRSARRVFHQPAFMASCLTISHKFLLSHVFASFTCLMFSVFSF